MSTHPARCRFCGRPIDWLAHDRTGKAAPIDVEPADDDPVIRLDDDRYHILTRAEREFEAEVAPSLPGIGPPRYSNHRTTCERRDAAREGFPR